MNKETYKLIPSKKVGEFTFNSDISIYIDKFDYTYYPCSDSTGWDTYKFKHPKLIVYTEDNIIESIACHEHCFYQGQNLIGMHISDFMKYSHLTPNEVDSLFLENEEHPQNVYEFETLNLQLWTRDNIIVTAICSYDEPVDNEASSDSFHMPFNEGK